jgi:hypothetical protein
MPKAKPLKNISCEAKGSKNHMRPGAPPAGRLRPVAWTRPHAAPEAATANQGLILEAAVMSGTKPRRTTYIGRMFRRSGTKERVITAASALYRSLTGPLSPCSAAASLAATIDTIARAKNKPTCA